MRTDEWEFDIQLSRLYNPKYEGELFPECSSYNTDNNATARKRGSNKHSNKQNSRYRKRQVMQFARNGYVKILLADDYTNNNERINKRNNNGGSSKPKVGKWRIGHSGVAFDIPVQVMMNGNNRRRRGNDNSSSSSSSSSRRRMTVVLHYHADIHLNKFGERPRMFRGVITRDR